MFAGTMKVNEPADALRVSSSRMYAPAGRGKERTSTICACATAARAVAIAARHAKAAAKCRIRRIAMGNFLAGWGDSCPYGPAHSPLNVLRWRALGTNG